MQSFGISRLKWYWSFHDETNSCISQDDIHASNTDNKMEAPTEEWMNMTEQQEIALGIIMIIDTQTTYMMWISKERKIVQPHYVTGSHLAIKMKHGWCHLKNQFRRFQWSATLKYGLWQNNIPSFVFYRFFLAYESTNWSLKTL